MSPEISIQEEKLSDGSIVYNVTIPELIVNCRDQKSAIKLADAIRVAVIDATIGL